MWWVFLFRADLWVGLGDCDCLEHIYNYFLFEMLDITNDITKHKNITVSNLSNRILKILDTLWADANKNTMLQKLIYIFL